MEKIAKIISLHIQGFSVREITQKTGKAKSTVQDYINRWRSHQLSALSDAVPLEEELIELSRYTKENGIPLESVKEALTHQGIVSDLGIDSEPYYKILLFLKDQREPVAVISELFSVIHELALSGITPSKLAEDVRAANEGINDDKKLLRDLQSENSRLTEENAKRKEENRKGMEEYSELKGCIREKQQSLNDIEKRLLDKNDTVERVTKLEEFMSRHHIEGEELIKFSDNAKAMGYDVRLLSGMKYMNVVGDKNGLTHEELGSLVEDWKYLSNHGVNSSGIRHMANKMRSSGVQESDVVKRFVEYCRNMEAHEDELRDVNGQVATARKELKKLEWDRTREKEKWVKEIATLDLEKKEYEGEIESLKAERDELSDAMDFRNSQYQEAENRAADALERLGVVSDYSRGISDLQKRIESLESERDNLVSGNPELKKIRDELNDGITLGRSIRKVFRSAGSNAGYLLEGGANIPEEEGVIHVSLNSNKNRKAANEVFKILFEIVSRYDVIISHGGIPSGFPENAELQKLHSC